MYYQILNVLGPIFAISNTRELIVLGSISWLNRPNMYPTIVIANIGPRTISSLVLLIATPSLVFSTLTSLEIDAATLLKMALSAILCVAIAAVAALLVLRALGMSYRTFLPSLIMPNSGNIGLPLVSLAFGEKGLALGISYFFTIALLQYTVGAAISSGEYRPKNV